MCDSRATLRSVKKKKKITPPEARSFQQKEEKEKESKLPLETFGLNTCGRKVKCRHIQ